MHSLSQEDAGWGKVILYFVILFFFYKRSYNIHTSYLVWPYYIHICKRTQDEGKSYCYPLYYFSSTKEVIIYMLAIRYGLTTYIFAKRPNRKTIDTVIRYTFFPL
jgi:hypothetical protein